MGLQCALPRVEPNLCLRNAFGLSEADAPTTPPPMFRCLHAPLPSRTVLSTLPRGSEASRRKPSASHTAGVASEPQKYALQWWDWSRFGAGLGAVFQRAATRIRGSPQLGPNPFLSLLPLRAFPCLLSPPPTPTLYASATHHLATPQLGRGRAWSVLGSVSIRAPPAAWQACAPWGADLEASLPCCRCRLRFDAVWPSTVEVLPIR
jgi:hypothetical protein